MKTEIIKITICASESLELFHAIPVVLVAVDCDEDTETYVTAQMHAEEVSEILQKCKTMKVENVSI